MTPIYTCMNVNYYWFEYRGDQQWLIIIDTIIACICLDHILTTVGSQPVISDT